MGYWCYRLGYQPGSDFGIGPTAHRQAENLYRERGADRWCVSGEYPSL